MKQVYVYIMTNKKYGVPYIGVTSDLVKRVWQHKNKVYEGFTARYNLNMLVYYEIFADEEHAILREKRMKHLRRAEKIRLINSINPEWVDLYEDICR